MPKKTPRNSDKFEHTIFEPGDSVEIIATKEELNAHAVRFRNTGDKGEVVRMIKNRNNYVEVKFMHPTKRRVSKDEVKDEEVEHLNKMPANFLKEIK